MSKLCSADGRAVIVLAYYFARRNFSQPVRQLWVSHFAEKREFYVSGMERSSLRFSALTRRCKNVDYLSLPTKGISPE